jgi:hypothetical protein
MSGGEGLLAYRPAALSRFEGLLAYGPAALSRFASSVHLVAGTANQTAAPRRLPTSDAVGLVSAAPSGNSTVGTVRFPELTSATNTAALGFFSMSTSRNWIPSRLSCDFKRTQYPHQRVVNTVGSSGVDSIVTICTTRPTASLFRPKRMQRIAFVTRQC